MERKWTHEPGNESRRTRSSRWSFIHGRLLSDTYSALPFVYFPRLTEWKAIKPDQCPAKRLFPLARGQLSDTLLSTKNNHLEWILERNRDGISI